MSTEPEAQVDLAVFEKTFYNRSPEAPETLVDPLVPEEPQEIDETEAETEAETPQPEDAPETESPEEQSQGEPRKNRKTANERIQELVQARRLVETEAAQEKAARIALEARLAELEKTQAAEEVPAVVAPVEPDPNAVGENGELLFPLGDIDPKFMAALVRYNFDLQKHEASLEKARAEAGALQQAEAQKVQAEYDAELAKATSDWNARLDAVAETLPDLREKVQVLDETFQSVPEDLGEYLARTIMSMEQGPEILYYLADNLDEASEIVAAGPVGATIALAKLEARLEKRDAKAVTKTKAPPPPPVTRGVGVSRSINPGTDNLADFERLFYET